MKTIRTQIRFASFVYYGAFLLCLTTAITSPAQTFKTLHYFHSIRGAGPYAGLLSTNGNLYGTTSSGGANGHGGTVFQFAPSGKLITIYSFCSQSNCTDGDGPHAGLVQANGKLYGTTCDGGENGLGTVFQINPSGKLKTIHSFDGTDGSCPTADLIQATDRNLYGITYRGGAYSLGTVFQMTLSGELTTMHAFAGEDGAQPAERLIQATDGNLYGTTSLGGDNGLGTVFQMTLSGELTKMHSFDGTDGANPYAGLIQATNGKLYGTTYGTTTRNGGANINGTVFQITLSGELTTIHNFAGTDGANPYADLIQASDGNLYGTTLRGGDGPGTVFQITPNGKLKTIHSFDNRSDGNQPFGDLIQASDGKLYGTTYGGGTFGVGTIFSLSK